MGEVVDADLEHLRLLKIGFYILAVLSGLGTLAALIFLGFGGVFASGVIQPQGGDADPKVVGWIFLAIGAALLVFGIVGTLLTWLVGRNLGEYRNRIFCMVMAGVWCLSMPFGTIVGIFTLIVLNRPSVKALFDASKTRAVALYP